MPPLNKCQAVGRGKGKKAKWSLVMETEDTEKVEANCEKGHILSSKGNSKEGSIQLLIC